MKAAKPKKIRKPIKSRKPVGPPEEVTDREFWLELNDGEFNPEKLYKLAEEALSRYGNKALEYSLPSSRSDYVFIFSAGGYSSGCDYEECGCAYGSICVKVKVKDNSYKEKLQKYEERMTVYEKRLEKYHEQYALWEAQRRPDLLKKKQAQAKKLKREMRRIEKQLEALNDE